MKNKVYLILFLSTILAFSISCKKKEAGKASISPISVLVEKPSKGRLEQYLDLSAEIVAPKEVNISSDVPGKVIRILKYEGSIVGRGQTIALIDRFVIGANYEYAPARTPIAGYVTTTMSKIGQSVAAGETIATVADIEELELEIYVPEPSVNDIKVGQKVKISVPSSIGMEFEANVTKKDLAVNPQTRTLLVKALINNKDNLLLPGMFSDVSILTRSEDNALIVPSSAVFTEDEKDYVYTVVGNDVPIDITIKKDDDDKKSKDNKDVKNQNTSNAKMKEVQILFASRDKIAISSGVTEDDEIVVFGREFLQDGSPIIPIRNSDSN